MNDNIVKILIKAPNQLVDDQTIHCERTWTVKHLKQHLSNVYPCKPHPDGQKLIYSGQLLSDEAVLSDVLRSYDGLENNTIHLVCSVKEAPYKCRSTAKPTPKPDYNASFTNESGMRQRQMTSNTRSPVILPTMNRNPRDVMQQTLLFQQAYLNYMAHFSQMINDGRMPTFDNSFFQNYQNNLLNQNNTVTNNANRDIPANDRGLNNEMEDIQEEGRLRDWLEWFYLGSRMFLLVSVVYFYSSPERFIMVIAMALILINIDVFRWRRNRQHQPVNPVPPPPPVIQEVTTDYVEPPDSDIAPMNWFNVAWSFMKTFFLSLVPENRDA